MVGTKVCLTAALMAVTTADWLVDCSDAWKAETMEHSLAELWASPLVDLTVEMMVGPLVEQTVDSMVRKMAEQKVDQLAVVLVFQMADWRADQWVVH